MVGFDVYTWVLVPFMIFFARIIDVTLGTIRLIFTAKGYKFIASVLAFFEIVVWLIAIRHILLNLTNYMAFIGYALGYATGTYMGIFIEEKISMGKVLFRIITKRNATKLVKNLAKTRYYFTSINAQGRKGDVKVIYLAIKRNQIPKIVNIIKENNPKAFYTIEDLRYGTEETISVIKYKRKAFEFIRKSK